MIVFSYEKSLSLTECFLKNTFCVDKEDLSKYYASILNSDDFLTDNPSSTIIDNIKGETMTDTVESTPTESVDYEKVVASKDEEIAKLKDEVTVQPGKELGILFMQPFSLQK